jgi:hypothetical protein
MADASGRVADASPSAEKPRKTPVEGYWLGGVGAELAHWKERALAAERRLAELEGKR